MNWLDQKKRASILPFLFLHWFAVGLLGTISYAGEPIDMTFTSTLDGTEQRYVMIMPEGFDRTKSYDVLIALHGHGSDRWQFVRDARGECRAAREFATRERMIFVSPDYRAKTSWMGPAAEADLVQILTEMRRDYRVKKVIVSGGSMGGTAALIFASLHPDKIDGVVAMNGTANLIEYDQFQEAISQSFGGSKKEKLEEYRKRSAEFNADRLTMPLALTTGGKDRLVPHHSILRLVELLKAKNPRILSIHRPDGGHETNYEDAMSAFEFVHSP